MIRAGWALGLAVALAGCDPTPAAPVDALGPDVEPGDLAPVDAAPRPDRSPPDATPRDAAPPDARALDQGVDGAVDAALPDAGPLDAAQPEPLDAGLPDAEPPDAEPPDAEPPDALPPDLCARQPDFDACVALGCRWTGEGTCRLVDLEPACPELDPILCGERLDCAPLGDRCVRTLDAPCVVLEPQRCAVRPAECRWRGGRCAPTDPARDPCAAVPFPACPLTAGCHWVPEPCVDCPALPLAQPWPLGVCVDGDQGPCGALDGVACHADPACVWDEALPRCLTRDQFCGRGDVITCFELGCFMVRYRLCDPVSRPDGSPDPDECDWREVFICEDV